MEKLGRFFLSSFLPCNTNNNDDGKTTKNTAIEHNQSKVGTGKGKSMGKENERKCKSKENETI